jgi:hypothetical protein
MIPQASSPEAADSAGLNPILGLVKFGIAAHLRELRTEGRLFMNELGYFRQLDNDPARGDGDEGLTYCYQPSRTVMEVRATGAWQRVGGIAGPIKYREETGATGSLFCMFALRASHAEAFADARRPLIDERNVAFGDSAIVITDADEFLRRVTAAVEREGLGLRAGPVEYVSEDSYHGPMGPFRKFSGYSYQSEFRLLVEPCCPGSRSLTLGSIEDISVMVATENINRLLRVRSDDGGVYGPL